MSDLKYRDVVRLLKLIDSSDSVNVELETGDMRLKVSRKTTTVASGPATPAIDAAEPDRTPAPAPSAPAKGKAPAAEIPGSSPVVAPMGGMFYATPAPGKPPFVEVGQEVRQGDQLGIVEVMKLFTPIIAETDGKVAAILVENQQSVAKDDVLMIIQGKA